VLAVHTAKDCLEVCSRTRVDVLLLDQKLPDGDGHAFCPAILKYNDQTKIIFSTAYPSFENAVKAIRAGAHDYLSKPFELEELGLAVNQALRMLDLEKVEQIQNFKNDREIEETILIGGSGGMREIRHMVGLAASEDAPVIITGETGTGKNVVARAIHFAGPFKKAPFISLNCSAIPENLIEAELFGYARGAFTGATAERKGFFEMAEGGTLFLDEIGEMPLHLQSKLLGVLEDKKIKRIGEDSIRQIETRIMAATSVDLEEAISGKTFRRDLYYRLGVIKIHIPPLRDRRPDIPELCLHLLKKVGRGRDVGLAEDEMGRLMEYDWPGNVRELKNVLERAVILQKGPDIRPSDLLCGASGAAVSPAPVIPGDAESPLTLEGLERGHIKNVLASFSGNYTRTAKALGISLNTLKRKLKSYGLS
jgi:DNA-binding NtrC family response regulator